MKALVGVGVILAYSWIGARLSGHGLSVGSVAGSLAGAWASTRLKGVGRRPGGKGALVRAGAVVGGGFVGSRIQHGECCVVNALTDGTNDSCPLLP